MGPFGPPENQALAFKWLDVGLELNLTNFSRSF